MKTLVGKLSLHLDSAELIEEVHREFTLHPTSLPCIFILNFGYLRQKPPFESSIIDLTFALLIGDYRIGENSISLFSNEK